MVAGTCNRCSPGGCWVVEPRHSAPTRWLAIQWRKTELNRHPSATNRASGAVCRNPETPQKCGVFSLLAGGGRPVGSVRRTRPTACPPGALEQRAGAVLARCASSTHGDGHRPESESRRATPPTRRRAGLDSQSACTGCAQLELVRAASRTSSTAGRSSTKSSTREL